MKTKHLNIENVSEAFEHNWFGLFPYVNIQHKYWYLWNIDLGWLGFNRMIQITRRDWKHKGNFNDD